MAPKYNIEPLPKEDTLVEKEYTTNYGTGSSVTRYTDYPVSSKQTRFKMESGISVPDTGASLYLYDINRKTDINIKLIPEGTQESYSPNIISISPFGIIHPINYYVGGSEKSISFSFDIHEDMIIEMGAGRNLYEVVNKIKKMSEPTVVESTNGSIFREPLIYFQLGDQFAGKGHISSSVTYKKPYSRGKYKLATIGISFIFHEFFKSDTISRLFVDKKHIISTQAYSLEGTDYENYGSGKSTAPIENFYREYLDYDYIIDDIFSDMRVSGNGIWDRIIVDTGFSEEEVVTQLTAGGALSEEEVVGSIFDPATYANRYGLAGAGNNWYNLFLDLMRLYSQLFNIIEGSKIRGYLGTVTKLKKLILHLDILDGEEVSHYNDWVGRSTAPESLWSDSAAYKALSDKLREVIEKQIKGYEFLGTGAGE